MDEYRYKKLVHSWPAPPSFSDVGLLASLPVLSEWKATPCTDIDALAQRVSFDKLVPDSLITLSIAPCRSGSIAISRASDVASPVGVACIEEAGLSGLYDSWRQACEQDPGLAIDPTCTAQVSGLKQ